MSLEQQTTIIESLCNAYYYNRHIGDVASLFTDEEIARFWPISRRVMHSLNPPINPPMVAPAPVAQTPPKRNRSKLYLMPK